MSKEAETLKKEKKDIEAREAALEKSLASKPRAGGSKSSTGGGAKISMAELGSVVSLKEDNFKLVQEEVKLKASLEEKEGLLHTRSA